MHASPPQPSYHADIVVIDLEASSPEAGVNDIQTSNIIEIGAVRLDRRTLEVKSTFSELVRPHEYPVQPFITQLTSITPEMVAGADDFGAVGRRFIEWFGPRNRAMLAAFGVYYDIPLLRRECRAFGIRYRDHFAGGAMDVRSVGLVWLAAQGRSTSGITVASVLEKMGLADLVLAHHRALDDARAAAAILQFFHLGRAAV